MSIARGFGINGQALYSNVAKPMEINLQFTVTPTNGLGITSLKSNGYVNNVFMNTSVAPTANNGMTNPDPLAGYALIQLKNNFNKFLSGISGTISTNSGIDVKIDNSVLIVGQPYVITTLGDATLSKWQAIGVPVGVTPAVGVSFIALTDGGAGNVLTSRVQTPASSGISHMEIIGNTDLMTNSNVPSNAGQFVMVQFIPLLAAHTHDLLIKGGQAASTTNNIAHYPTDILGKEAATDATILGIDSITKGGVLSSSSTNTTITAISPVTGSIVYMKLMFDGSSVTVDGL